MRSGSLDGPSHCAVRRRRGRLARFVILSCKRVPDSYTSGPVSSRRVASDWLGRVGRGAVGRGRDSAGRRASRALGGAVDREHRHGEGDPGPPPRRDAQRGPRHRVARRRPRRGRRAASSASRARTGRTRRCWPTPTSTRSTSRCRTTSTRQWTIAAARAGKHVLCEKPLALTRPRPQRDGRRAAAGPASCSWKRSCTATTRRGSPCATSSPSAASAGCSAVQTLVLVLQRRSGQHPQHREAGGGALYDIGCYTVNLSRLLFDAEPARSQASIVRDPELGVDVLTSAILEFDGRRDVHLLDPGGDRPARPRLRHRRAGSRSTSRSTSRPTVRPGLRHRRRRPTGRAGDRDADVRHGRSVHRRGRAVRGGGPRRPAAPTRARGRRRQHAGDRGAVRRGRRSRRVLRLFGILPRPRCAAARTRPGSPIVAHVQPADVPSPDAVIRETARVVVGSRRAIVLVRRRRVRHPRARGTPGAAGPGAALRRGDGRGRHRPHVRRRPDFADGRRGRRLRLRRRRATRALPRRRRPPGRAVPQRQPRRRRPAVHPRRRIRPRTWSVTGAYPIDIDGDGIVDLAVLRVGGTCSCAVSATAASSAPTRPGRSTASHALDDGVQRHLGGHAALPTLAVRELRHDRRRRATRRTTCADNQLFRPGDRRGRRLRRHRSPLTPGYCTLSMLFSDWDRLGPARPPRQPTTATTTCDGRGAALARRGRRGAPPVHGGRRLADAADLGHGHRQLRRDRRRLPGGLPDQPGRQQAADAAGRPRPARRTGTSRWRSGVTAAQPFTGGDALPSTAWHPEFEDVNNDGLIDLFVSKGNVGEVPDYAIKDPSNLFLGQPDGTFVEGAPDGRHRVASTGPRRGARGLQPRRPARPRRGRTSATPVRAVAQRRVGVGAKRRRRWATGSRSG